MQVVGVGQCSWDELALVDMYPRADTKQEVLRLEEQGGGPVATALVALGRLGVRCRFHGVVGDDESGRRIVNSLRAEGVDTTGVRVREGSESQRAFIVVEPKTGRRTIFWKRAGGTPLRPDELGENFLDGADFLLVDGLMADVSLHAARRARQWNVSVMLDAGRHRTGMLDVARSSDFVVGSEEFARDMGWEGSAEGMELSLLRSLRELGCRALTVTLGARGSMTASGGRLLHVPAFPVEALDSTGAGDVFHGGYIYGLLQGWELERVLRFASAFAALKCRRVGGRKGIPTLEETVRFMAGLSEEGSKEPMDSPGNQDKDWRGGRDSNPRPPA